MNINQHVTPTCHLNGSCNATTGRQRRLGTCLFAASASWQDSRIAAMVERWKIYPRYNVNPELIDHGF